MSLPALIILLIAAGLVCLVAFLFWLKVKKYKESAHVSSTLLEITPPSKTTKTSESIKQLYVLIHRLGSSKRYKDRGRYSLEIVSTRHDGIRYLVRLPRKHAENFKSQITAYMPGIKFAKTKDYIKAVKHPVIEDFKQSEHFA